jgi:hypothetical protein
MNQGLAPFYGLTPFLMRYLIRVNSCNSCLRSCPLLPLLPQQRQHDDVQELFVFAVLAEQPFGPEAQLGQDPGRGEVPDQVAGVNAVQMDLLTAQFATKAAVSRRRFIRSGRPLSIPFRQRQTVLCQPSLTLGAFLQEVLRSV